MAGIHAPDPSLLADPPLRYPREFAAQLAVRILMRLLPDESWHAGFRTSGGSTFVYLCDGETSHEAALQSHDDCFSPDAVRATAALLLRYSNEHHLAVQAMYYPLPADPNEEEEV